MKALASFLGHSLLARLIYLLWQTGAIDPISAVISGIIICFLSASFFFIWHQNPSMNANIINFIGGLSLVGALLGILIQL